MKAMTNANAKEQMTDKEILSYQGHEFTYVFGDGSTIKAYVKRIDLKQNKMSCWSFDLTTDQGETVEPLNKEEEALQACCVMASNTREDIVAKLVEIRDTGQYAYNRIGFGFGGCNF